MDRSNYDHRRGRRPERREWSDRNQYNRRDDRRGYQNSRPGKRQHESELPARKRFTPDTLTLVERKAQLVGTSLWDVEALEYKGVEADVLKMVLPGLTAGAILPSRPSAAIERIKNVKPLTAENSKSLSVVHISGPSNFEKYAKELFPGEALTPLGDDKWLLPSPRHVAILLGLPGDFEVRRPAGLVLPGNSSDVFCSAGARVIVDGPEKLERAVVVQVKEHTLQFVENGDSGIALFEPPFHIQTSFNINERGPSERNIFVMQVLNAIPPHTQHVDKSTLDQIEKTCSEFGNVKAVSVKMDATVFFPRVIVAFETADACGRAIDTIGGTMLNGRRVITAPSG